MSDAILQHFATEWGITRSRVWQIEQNAMRKIRNAILTDDELRGMVGECCGKQLAGLKTHSINDVFRTTDKQKARRERRKHA